MSDIDGEYARVRDAFAKPTIGLLGGKWSPVAITIFRLAFSREAQFVPVDRLHTQVEEYLAQLRHAGVEVPEDDGRTLCRQWLNRRWLLRTSAADLLADPTRPSLGDDGPSGGTDAGDEQYSLTSHALEALATIDNLAQDRAMISESRLAMILDSVKRVATKASPDRDEHLLRLNTQIAELTAERDRIEQGGEVQAASAADMHDGYANLSDLIRQLPGDFKRVEESVQGMHRRIVQDFRDDERPIGLVLDEYLRRTDELMSATPEGRAFEGALRLLGDDALLHELKHDLQAILAHPFAGELTGSEARGFRATVSVIRQGIDDVLTQRSRLTSTLRDHIVNHDVVTDRELDGTLRRINQLLATWMQTAGPRSTVDVGLIPEALEIEHLRERFYDPDLETPPPALVEETDARVTPLTIAQLRTQGGPLLAEMRDAFAEGVVERGATSARDVFDALPEELRRPVELYGMLHIGTQIGVLGDAAADDDPELAPPTHTVEAIRPNGERVRFELPAIPLTLADAAVLRYEPALLGEDTLSITDTDQTTNDEPVRVSAPVGDTQ